MITKLVVKDYVAKRCPYLTKSELEDKSLIELIKNSIPVLGDLNDALAMDKDEGEDEPSSEPVLNLTEISKDYPHLRRDIKKLVNSVPKNNVEKLVEEYTDDQLVSKLSREYFEYLYGKENCKRCDVNGAGEEIINQGLLTKMTEDVMKDTSIKVIFEGQIEVDDLRARFDVMVRNDDGTFDLYEVKGTNNVTTHPKDDRSIDNKIKDKYLYDLAFQYYLYTKAGYVFKNIGYVITNSDYEMSICSYPPKDKIELYKLFSVKLNMNLKDGAVSMLRYIGENMYAKQARSTQESIDAILLEIESIASNTKYVPIKRYECKKGPQCPFLNLCFKDATELNSIFKLTKWNLYNGNWHTAKKLMEEGIERISDIPDHEVQEKFPEEKECTQGYKKRSCARMQIDLEKGKYNTKYLLDLPRIEKVLTRDYRNDQIKYLIFFDFESFQNPVPLCKDSHPWKQVVSQYSMHVCDVNYDLTKHDFDKGTGGGITHFEYIGNPDIDKYDNPSFKLYETLKAQLESVGIDVFANDYRVIVFNRNFEKTRMDEFVRDFASRVGEEMSKFVTNFNFNVVDLLDFFTDGGIYSRDFGGRGSLKVVQPALTTDPDVLAYYHNLGLPFDFEYSLDYHKGDKCLVFNGAICLDLYKSLLVREHLGEKDKGIPTSELLKEALAYCKIDSWGTVIIYDIIKNVFDGLIKLDATYIK